MPKQSAARLIGFAPQWRVSSIGSYGDVPNPGMAVTEWVTSYRAPGTS